MMRKTNIPNRLPQAKKQFLQLDQETYKVFQHGLISHQRGQLAEAKLAYEQVLSKQPKHFDAMHLLGLVAAQTKNPALAEELIRKAIQLNPNFALAYSNRGIILKELKRLDDALVSCDKAIALKPDFAEAFYNRGVVLQQLERLDDAISSYEKAIALNPIYADAFNGLGNVLQEVNRLDDSIASYDKAIALKPGYVEAFNNRGNALKEIGQLDKAVESYDNAIVFKSDYAEAFYNRGIALQGLNRIDDAIASYDKAIFIKPLYADAFNNRGNALQEIKRRNDAVASYDKAIAINPSYAEAFNNRGNVLREIKRLDDSLESFDSAIAINPVYAEAFNNRGIVLKEIRRLDDALASFKRAIVLKPDYADAFYNHGFVLQKLKRLDEAIASYDRAIFIKPDYEFLLGVKLHAQMHLCDWSDLSKKLEELEAGIFDGLKVTNPFPMLGLVDRADLQWKASRIYASEKYPASGVGDKIKIQPKDGKIRIGYYSADFHNHATSFLMAELLEAHDPKRFELYGFSFGPDQQDEMRRRVTGSFHCFLDVTQKSDREIAQISRDLGIDIAVDLKGFTEGSRMGIFAEQCAPVQVNFLGYPGTFAAPYVDYIVADETLIPKESQQYYTENVIYLPHSYQVNDSKRKIADKVFTRHELGLPEQGFVFCCFNNHYKILPATFDIWMRLLKLVDGSVLWLLVDNPVAIKNLCKEAEVRGVNPARLVFAPRMTLEEHLARQRVADLFIDTLPCNAHTTASDALWAGLPVLTQMGQSFAARVAASLLNAMDLPELITNTREEYEARAVELAQDPFLLAEIKKKLEQNKLTSPLFNGRLFARHIEAAYVEIHRRYIDGERPDHIHVEALVS